MSLSHSRSHPMSRDEWLTVSHSCTPLRTKFLSYKVIEAEAYPIESYVHDKSWLLQPMRALIAAQITPHPPRPHR